MVYRLLFTFVVASSPRGATCLITKTFYIYLIIIGVIIMQCRVLLSGLTQDFSPGNPQPIVEALIDGEWVCIDGKPEYKKDWVGAMEAGIIAMARGLL
jgi:hypothetical protein